MKIKQHLYTVPFLLLLLASCVSISRSPERVESFSLPPTRHGALADFASSIEGYLDEGQSGLLLLPANSDALRWRLAMTDEAQDSIDAQYFLWDADYSGALLLKRLLLAADRGVRVRLLVDDIFLDHPDRAVASLSSHPNVEIRIFNPNPSRRTSAGATFRFLLELRRLNRRMHNKLFIADGRVAIIGGRNIGDKYFGLSENYNFRDLDVLATGAVVPDMAYSFDQFWNSPYAHPGQYLHRLGSLQELERLRQELSRQLEIAARPDPALIDPASWQELLLQGVASTVAAEARFVYDHPYERENRSVVASLTELIGPGAKDVLIVTPYFLPDDKILDALVSLGNDYVDVRLLVPSLASINHTVVHGHYSKYRDAVIDNGIQLYEYRHDPAGDARSYVDTAPVQSGFVSMHMKAVVSGEERAFIGSLNFDPRGMHINTENGLIIESPRLVAQLRRLLEPMTSDQEAWRVTRDGDRTIWNSGTRTLTRPPVRSRLQRFSNFFFGLLPMGNHL